MNSLMTIVANAIEVTHLFDEASLMAMGYDDPTTREDYNRKEAEVRAALKRLSTEVHKARLRHIDRSRRHV